MKKPCPSLMRAGLVVGFVGLGASLAACGLVEAPAPEHRRAFDAATEPATPPAGLVHASLERNAEAQDEIGFGRRVAESKGPSAPGERLTGASSTVERLAPPSIETPREPETDGLEVARTLATSAELRTRAPALLARPDGSEQKELPFEALRTATVLMATRARTLVDCTFSNPYPRTLEGTFMVRLPDGASPCSLGMFQGAGVVFSSDATSNLLPPRLDDPGLLLERNVPLAQSWSLESQTVNWGALRPAQVVEEEQGQIVYEKITRRRIDPALMEWSGGNSFRTRIFPIGASSRKRVFFVYDQPPVDVAGRTTLALPVPEKLPRSFRAEAAVDPRAYRDATIVSKNGEAPLVGSADSLEGASGLRDWSFLKGVASPGEKDTGSFLLSATPRVPRVRAGFSHAKGIAGVQVHARISPEANGRESVSTREAVFVLDTSLSQKAQLAASCGRLLREILERDATIERFRVVTFDVTARDLFPGTRENTREERERTFAEVERLWLEGATSLESAFAHLEKTIPEGESPTLFLLSDAQVTWGIEDPRELERAYPRTFGSRWICYQLGDAAVNRPLVERLARSGGRVVSVLGSQDLASAAVAHRFAPTEVRSVKVEGVTATDLVVAGSPRAIFPRQVLEVGFRLGEKTDARAARIVLETESGKQTFPLSQAGFDPVAGRAWAELTASTLLELRDKDADKAALALSQRFGLANRVASFLILETDIEYQQNEIAPEELDLARLSDLARSRDARRPVGGPDVSCLDDAALAFQDDLRAHPGKAWPRAGRASAPSAGPGDRPDWGERPDPVEVRAEAVRRESRGRSDEALRILSSIIEESPRDARMLRLAGFTLMSWRRFPEAAALFARARTLRPFEAQALLCEALALEGAGRTADAALRFEIALAGGKFDPRHERFSRESARRLYARFLVGQGERGEKRLRALGLSSLLPLPAHEVHLLWNLDECDVDLHVQESGLFGKEISYRSMTSPSGGRLHWDDTVGLGPEIYTHPKSEPALVFVHYFGTTANEGTVPSATLVVYWKNGEVVLKSAVLSQTQQKIVLWESGAN
ncbi:hypothetical protein HY251_13790 [bacterium]|nr:hypothetical protein [bacterium]